jgi:peptidoglycan biosynthesis protein MviN/MurJ (putative lipid II flippase)
MGLQMIFERVFYSLHDARTPLKANIIIFILSIGLYFSSFLPEVAFYGVFAADMTASWMTLLYYISRLRKTGKVSLKNSGLFGKAVIFFTISLAAGAFIYPLHRFVYQPMQNPLLSLCIAASEFFLFALFYYIITRILKMDLKR